MIQPRYLKYRKKGFTIVELVIVIAVIAILASVLIPTFSGIVRKAQESKAIQEAKNAAMPKLIEIDNDFKAGKITAFESIRRGYFAILEQEFKNAKNELADNQNRPEVKAFFEKIRKENKNGSTSICE